MGAGGQARQAGNRSESPLRAVKEAGRDHWAVEVAQEHHRGHPMRRHMLGQADGGVERLAAQINRGIGLGHLDPQAGMPLVKSGQARDEPAHGQGANTGDVQLALGADFRSTKVRST